MGFHCTEKRHVCVKMTQFLRIGFHCFVTEATNFVVFCASRSVALKFLFSNIANVTFKETFEAVTVK